MGLARSWNSEFLASFQAKSMLLAHGPHTEWQDHIQLSHFGVFFFFLTFKAHSRLGLSIFRLLFFCPLTDFFILPCDQFLKSNSYTNSNIILSIYSVPLCMWQTLLIILINPQKNPWEFFSHLKMINWRTITNTVQPAWNRNLLQAI